MLLIFWILCAIVTAIIAGSRGRNWFGWLLIGFLIGIFGVILVAALPSIRRPVQIPYAESVPTKLCPDCGEAVLAVANVCKHCGYRFGAPRHT